MVASGTTLRYPPRTADYQHEVELVVAIGRGGADIAVSDALDHVFGYAVGLDMTRRDLQAEAKKDGRPWDMAKGFDQSAPCGAITPAGAAADLSAAAITLTVNGETRQASDLSQMTWSVAETIADLSTYVTLQAGDLIFTGTPEGVSPVRPGDRLTARIAGLTDLVVDIAP